MAGVAIAAIALASVAAPTQGLQVAEVVGAALGQGQDVINFEVFGGAFGREGAIAVLAAVAIALKHKLPDFGGEANARKLGHDGSLFRLRMSSKGEAFSSVSAGKSST